MKPNSRNVWEENNSKQILSHFPLLHLPNIKGGLLWWLSGKEPASQCRRRGFDPWVRKIPWRRKWQPTPVFLPGKSHGQRSLASCSPGGHEELDTTWLNNTTEGTGKPCIRAAQSFFTLPSDIHPWPSQEAATNGYKNKFYIDKKFSLL